MKKVIYLFAVAVMTVGFVSCNQDGEEEVLNTAEQELELRATSLGFSNVEDYKASVWEQCQLGNHENCEIQSDGTHQACVNHEHSGTKHDGTPHQGNKHEADKGNGHSNGSSHDKGNGKHH